MVNPPFSLAELHLSSETNFRNFLAQRQNLPFNEQGWRTFSWQKDSSLAEIRSSLLAFLQEAGDRQTQFSRINSLRVSERAPSGRVSQLTVSTDRGRSPFAKMRSSMPLQHPTACFFMCNP